VNPAGSPNPQSRIATVQEDGPKTIQLGNGPSLPCD
jgi:hypothetical protein